MEDFISRQRIILYRMGRYMLVVEKVWRFYLFIYLFIFYDSQLYVVMNRNDLLPSTEIIRSFIGDILAWNTCNL